MECFNHELIKNIKLMQSQDEENEFLEEKYTFIRYVFSKLESISADSIDICNEEFEELESNIDAYYYDEDTSVYNLYLAIYNNQNDDNSFLDKEHVDKYYKKIINFVSKTFSGKFIDFDDSSFTYDIANEIHSLMKQVEIVVNVVSNFNIPKNYKKDDIEEINGQNVSFRTYDLEDLKNKFKQITNIVSTLDCNSCFDCEISALNLVSSIDFDVYLFGMKGTWLAQLYKQDSDRLLEANVRSYLKRTAKVNAGILNTVKNNPEQFVSFNNGISAVATKVCCERDPNHNKIIKIQTIDNFQIVNGGQTTATLYECMKDKLNDNLDNVTVPVKLTVVKNIGNAESFIRDISVFSNTQTAIKKSDPPSNLPFYIQFKKVSLQCLSTDGTTNYMCYFERTNGEYDTEFRRNNGSKKFSNINPKSKKFDKIDLARAINCWEQLPFITCQGKEKNFSYFNDTVKNQILSPDETYFKNAYAVVIIYRKLDKIAKKLGLSVKSNVVAYTISMISYIYDKQLDLNEVWEKKDLPPYLEEIVYKLLTKVHDIIANPPNEYPEPRMWARKEKCWEETKKINLEFSVVKTKTQIEFFVKNDALIFISNPDNFNNSLTWMKLILWDNKFHILSKQQLNMVKMMRSHGDNRVLTKKQIDFLKDIFIIAVKQGYQYQ